MTDLVTITDGKTVTTSLKIAEVFGKEHCDVLKAIRALEIPEEWREGNFSLSSYQQEIPNGGRKSCPMYLITRDGFTLLAMGFTGKKAMEFKLAYIDAFNKMEAALKGSCDPITKQLAEEIRQKALNQVERDLRAIRGTVEKELFAMGYSLDKEFYDAFSMKDGVKENSSLYKQQIKRAIRGIVNPQLGAAVKLSIELGK